MHHFPLNLGSGSQNVTINIVTGVPSTDSDQQNAEKCTHVKGKLLDQVMILFNCVPFQNGNFSSKKEFAPRGSEFSFMSSSLLYEKISLSQ